MRSPLRDALVGKHIVEYETSPNFHRAIDLMVASLPRLVTAMAEEARAEDQLMDLARQRIYEGLDITFDPATGKITPTEEA